VHHISAASLADSCPQLMLYKGLPMRKLISITALILGMTVVTSTQAGAGRWGADLRFVAETTIPQSSGIGTVSICHLFDYEDVFFVPVYMTLQGYVFFRVTDAPATTFAK